MHFSHTIVEYNSLSLSNSEKAMDGLDVLFISRQIPNVKDLKPIIILISKLIILMWWLKEIVMGEPQDCFAAATNAIHTVEILTCSLHTFCILMS